MANEEKRIPLSVVPDSFKNDKGQTINFVRYYIVLDGQRIEMKCAREEDKQLLKYLVKTCLE